MTSCWTMSYRGVKIVLLLKNNNQRDGVGVFSQTIQPSVVQTQTPLSLSYACQNSRKTSDHEVHAPTFGKGDDEAVIFYETVKNIMQVDFKSKIAKSNKIESIVESFGLRNLGGDQLNQRRIFYYIRAALDFYLQNFLWQLKDLLFYNRILKAQTTQQQKSPK